MTPVRRWASSAARILPLAWPVFIGQLAVLAFATIDTLLVARYSAIDLAALAVGNAVYVSVFIGLTGVVQAVAPITGQLFGARRLPEAGQQLHQALWLALGLSVLGCSFLVFPAPFLALAQTPPDVADKVRAHLGALAFALPSALLFTAFRGFNTAVSRPKMVMALQVVGLALKVPLTALLVFGAALPLPAGWPWSEMRIPALGTPGCGIATAIAMAVQLLAAAAVLLRSPFYAPFGLHSRRLQRPQSTWRKKSVPRRSRGSTLLSRRCNGCAVMANCPRVKGPCRGPGSFRCGNFRVTSHLRHHSACRRRRARPHGAQLAIKSI